MAHSGAGVAYTRASSNTLVALYPVRAQISIYVERSHLLWKAPEALEFLLKGAVAAADIAEGKGVQEEGFVMDAEDWAAVREETFPQSTKNEYG